MKDLGWIYCLLGLEVWQRPGEIFLSQKEVYYSDPPTIWDDGLQREQPRLPG